MKNLFCLLPLFATLLLSCTDQEIEKNVPQCIETKIKAFAQISCEADASVKEYQFQDKVVYVFDPGICGADMASKVMDGNCEILGYLGGISGNMYIKEMHFDNAKMLRVVWQR